MENIKENYHLKTCLFMEFTELQKLIRDITGGLKTLTCDSYKFLYFEDTSVAENSNKYWKKGLYDTLTELFGVTVRDVHVDNGAILGVWIYYEEFETDIQDRIEKVVKFLNVNFDDAIKIVEHLKKHDCFDWIDNHNENAANQPLTDVHYENSFEDMIDWKFEDAKPSEIIYASSNINEYEEMLQLSDKVIFWFGLV